MFIGSHSHNHIDLTTLNINELSNELIFSKKSLEDKIGIKINNFSYPFGKVNKFVYKKTKSRKVKANHIPNGWVKLKRVNGKIQKTYGKPTVRRQRNQHLTVATQKMFNGMWQTMEDSWSDGFWDCRQGQLEKILSDNLYNSDDDSLSDEEYYSDDNKEEEEETNTHLGRTKRS